MLKFVTVLLILFSFKSYSMDKKEILSAWKDVNIAFFEELKDLDETVKVIWTNEEITSVAAMSSTRPRELYISSSLLDLPNLKKTHLYNLFCHELGHIVGGAPYVIEFAGDNRKISTEGQADYFTTKNCMKRLIDVNEIESIHDQIALEDIRSLTVRGCVGKTCQALSIVSKEALEVIGGFEDISFESVDTFKVPLTYLYQNNPQCRLDTFIAGAISSNSYKTFNFQMTFSSSGGKRPSCWYRELF
ncbi:MAG: hypothetical protein BM556_07810 [Bacteriovorax sp. MedPE-SWde]|nr:MAG: hypothetical protein BM556_07810 [Bacteriovorax sp. MedPE-SWde]